MKTPLPRLSFAEHPDDPEKPTQSYEKGDQIDRQYDQELHRNIVAGTSRLYRSIIAFDSRH